jgi:hypothetical protein
MTPGGSKVAAGLALMRVLGLGHGLDPDHIACIDGLTWRAPGTADAGRPGARAQRGRFRRSRSPAGRPRASSPARSPPSA